VLQRRPLQTDAHRCHVNWVVLDNDWEAEFCRVAKAHLRVRDAGFDVLVACTFNYEAHTTEFSKLGRVSVPKVRMNADLHMAGDFKNTSKGNLFVIFGEPDIDILPADDNQVRIRINGVDVFYHNTGEVR